MAGTAATSMLDLDGAGDEFLLASLTESERGCVAGGVVAVGGGRATGEVGGTGVAYRRGARRCSASGMAWPVRVSSSEAGGPGGVPRDAGAVAAMRRHASSMAAHGVVVGKTAE